MIDETLYEGLELLAKVNDFNKLSESELKQTERNILAIEAIGNFPESDKPSSLLKWKEGIFNTIPDDVKPFLHVMTLDNPESTLSEYLSVIHATSLQGAPVRDALRELHYRVANAAGNVGSNPTVVGIMRGAIPAMMGVEESLQSRGISAQLGAIRICRGHDKRDSLSFYLDPNLTYMDEENIHKRDLIITDSAVATGGSMFETALFCSGMKPRSIQFQAMTITPYAAIQLVRNMQDLGFESPIYAADIGDVQGKDGYILPMIGDIGHRVHQTKTNGELTNLSALIGRYSSRERIRHKGTLARLYAAASQEMPAELTQ